MAVIDLNSIKDTSLWKHLKNNYFGADKEIGETLANNLIAICNEAYDRMMIAAKAIRLSYPDGGENFFTSLLTHEMPYVVSVAAFNLIPFNPKLARKTYERLAKDGEGEIAFNAEMTLKEWKAGRLDPDWFMKQ